MTPQEKIQKVRAELNAALKEAKKKTDVVLVEQGELESALFKLNAEMGHLKEDNERMEREIRTREVGSRGGR